MSTEIIDYTKRFVPSVPLPQKAFPKDEEICNINGVYDNDFLKRHFQAEGRLTSTQAIQMLTETRKYLKKEANIIRISDPVTVVGDIHGQYYDLTRLLEIGGDPKDNSYLFLGDYVDRGVFGMECFLLLCSYKINYPNTMILLRGNHECRHLATFFNFKQEVLLKYDLQVYNEVMKTFDYLPLGCILNEKFFCVHGGISPDIIYVDDINNIDRFKEVPHFGSFCDLLWSDPLPPDQDDSDDNFSNEPSFDISTGEALDSVSNSKMFQFNDVRNCSYLYNYRAVCLFLQTNNLLSIFRAHEVQDEGYKLYRRRANFPTVICVFSAPNYCDSYNNAGAIIKFSNNSMNIRQFKASDHPYVLPNFIDAFTWSIPYIGEQVTEIYSQLLSICNEAQVEEESSASDAKPVTKLDKDRVGMIKKKIFTIGRMSRMYTTLRQEEELILKLKGLNGGKIPTGLLAKGATALKDAVLSFEGAKKIDADNEKLPSSSQSSPTNSPMVKKPSFKLKSGDLKKEKSLPRLDSPSVLLQGYKIL